MPRRQNPGLVAPRRPRRQRSDCGRKEQVLPLQNEHRRRQRALARSLEEKAWLAPSRISGANSAQRGTGPHPPTIAPAPLVALYRSCVSSDHSDPIMPRWHIFPYLAKRYGDADSQQGRAARRPVNDVNDVTDVAAPRRRAVPPVGHPRAISSHRYDAAIVQFLCTHMYTTYLTYVP